MDQNPNYNDPVIILRLSPRCSIQSLSNMHEALRNMNGVSEVEFDIKSMKLCIRSTIDPFVLVREIDQAADAKVKIILYIREPMAGVDKDPKNPNGSRNAMEDEQFEDDDYKGKRNGQGNQRGKPDIPNGWRNDDEEDHVHFEDDKDVRNRGRSHRPDYYEDVKDSEYVCRNYREDSPRMFSDGQRGASGMSSRDHYIRSRSFRFDERNFRGHFRSQSSRFDARNY